MKSASAQSTANPAASTDVSEVEDLRKKVARLEKEVRRASKAHAAMQDDYENVVEDLQNGLDNSEARLVEAKTALEAMTRRRFQDRPGSWNSSAFFDVEEVIGWELSCADDLAERRRLERRIIEQAAEEGIDRIEGFCCFCDAPSEFLLDGGLEIAASSWREQLACLRCFLHNRQRAVVHYLSREPPKSGDRIYLTEQVTAFYEKMSLIYDNVYGSEYLADGVAPGEVDERGVRHEDLTALTFADESFDLIGSFDVLEHIPDYHRALQEIARVLSPGGRLLLTIPFDPRTEEHQVRAKLSDDGEIEHLMEPEYHGDPLTDEGCLSFYLFGWQICDELRELGFRSAEWRGYWSRENAYLGPDQYLLIAEKEGPSSRRSGLQSRLQGRIAAQHRRIYELQHEVDGLSREQVESDRRSKKAAAAYESQIRKQAAVLEEIQTKHAVDQQEAAERRLAEQEAVAERQQEMRRAYEAQIEEQEALRRRILDDREVAEQKLSARFQEDLQAAEERFDETRGAYEEQIEKVLDANRALQQQVEKIPDLLEERRAIQERSEDERRAMQERYEKEISQLTEVTSKMDGDVRYLQGEIQRLQEELQTARTSEP